MPDLNPPHEVLTEVEVLAAADVLVAAFRATDTEAYFRCFAPDATFVFHTEPRRLEDRAAYEELWAGWIADGWRVTDCISSAPRVQVFGTTAVFTHHVRTTTSVGGASETTSERETIVFRRAGSSIEAVHEHLGPAPEDTTEESAA
ncbi:nuclear transport factor 2 family protein [Arthrobacter antioxidans]|uniref:nuclear transport factor 2 family protein n=1 Tax=Arthrobacter antioxidans TaxID=2895818 RepID=UPI001FFE3247|nr:nuclear transport factor 2 family protein [Arthrobacter antioxidans]